MPLTAEAAAAQVQVFYFISFLQLNHILYEFKTKLLIRFENRNA